MRAGSLDRRVTLQRKTVTLSASGDPVETWTTLATRWASVGPVRGSERFSDPQLVAKELVEVRIRYSAATADLHPGDRIVYPVGGTSTVTVYDILAVHEIGRREGQRIIAERNPVADPITFDDDMLAVFAEFTTPPTDARKFLIRDLISALKVAGVWSKARVLYVHAAADSQAALVNWVEPGTSTATLNGTPEPTFAIDRGFFGDGVPSTGGWIDSGYTPADDDVVAVTDYCQFAHILAYGGSQPAAFEPMVGTTIGGGCVIQRTSSGTIAAQIHSPNAAGFNPGGNLAGHFAASASIGTQNILYADGALRSAGGATSATKVPGTFVGLRSAGTARGPFEIAAMGVLRSLTEAQHVALYSAFNTYLQALTAP